MKRIISLLLVLGTTFSASAQTSIECSTWKYEKVGKIVKPLFSEQASVDNENWDDKALLETTQFASTQSPAEWNILAVGADSLISEVNTKSELLMLAGWISTDRWTKASLNIGSNAVYDVFLNGNKQKTQATVSASVVKVDLELETGKHEILLKLITKNDSLRFSANISADSTANIEWTLDQRRPLALADLEDGESVRGLSVSPSGRYVLIHTGEVISGSGKVQSSSRIYDLEQNKNVLVLHDNYLRAQWLPRTDRLSYTIKKGEQSEIYVFDLQSGEEKQLAANIHNLGSITWSPTEDFIIFSRSVSAEKVGELQLVYGNDDRIPGNRDRSYFSKLDLETGLTTALTAGQHSTRLQDISPDGKRLLFSTERNDYTEVPFSKQNLYELNIETHELDTVWVDKLYGGNCNYSPDGTKLLVSGAPETFGELGVNVSKKRIPNSYDTQLFLFDLETGNASALTRDFDPSVQRSTWNHGNDIYLTAVEGDYVKLFKLDLTNRKFANIKLPVDIAASMELAYGKSVAVFSGTGVNSPEKIYSIDLENGKSRLLDFPKENVFENVEFGASEDWDFVNKNGTTIDGRIYYPVGYDASKKYPLIVYYYGGTTPTNRSFGGRYPKEWWAAQGYMVYVLQPSGAIGYGQDFSALHVNGWGFDAIDDIIDGTKKFLKAHPSADAENVGCIGASYGGYTTMLLQTRTDIFKTAVSHAGISDISSYWGEGYWGYSYSAGATRNSYPWNRRDIYVDNSPLFNADKFRNSILLIHGTADTNVPVGESKQFYAALKILGKDAELVLVEGEDHHILEYHKRQKWFSTIVAWFDMKLKNQPAHWEELYPKKNL